jgi:uncharacterized MAPEG superfamily protein
MSWPLWSILIAGLLPYLGTAIAKWGFKSFDNNNPRVWLANQTGFRARANASQSNSFESFPFFAVAVLVATIQGADSNLMDLFSTIYIAARLAYIVCYAANWAGLRSLFWFLGIISIVAFFVISAH